MSLAGPEPISSNPLRRLAGDLEAELRAGVTTWPPGDNGLDPRRTHRLATDPLGMLLDAYARHGPIFSVRLLTSRNVFMIGPEANHHILVSHFDDFRWRDGGFGELVPLLGDGLLTIDGDFHRRARRIVLPAFHKESIAAAKAVIDEEVEHALAPWQDGTRVDLYRWARVLALRVAMRALFGLEADAAGTARDFERALGFYGRDVALQALRGPLTPFAAMLAARRRLDRLIYGEIARRRATGERGADILSMLLDARDAEDGSALSDRHVRDQVMTLLFAGHDTTTATIAFLFFELARNPVELRRLLADPARLELAIDETLRLYPPAWIGPRRAVRAFEFGGYTVPAGVPVNYSSWVSHRLPDVFEQPHAFRPDRMAPAERAKLPRGAYVPFGGGSRMCLGKRFGEVELRALTAVICSRFRVEPVPGGPPMRVATSPTLGPKGGLRVTVRPRR